MSTPGCDLQRTKGAQTGAGPMCAKKDGSEIENRSNSLPIVPVCHSGECRNPEMSNTYRMPACAGITESKRFQHFTTPSWRTRSSYTRAYPKEPAETGQPSKPGFQSATTR
jgi:hypothetical protein